MGFGSIEEWLDWQQRCHPVGIDLGLDRVSEVARRLGLTDQPSERTVITVAGTNGKGSCVRTLEVLLGAAQLSCGAFYSPHISRYNERIRMDGVEASDAQICKAFEAIDAARNEITLTYFEFSALAAMWLFSEADCQYWILEVGLGGRLDATNIVDSDVAIITSVDLDHMEWLGDTREDIGREKAGIARAGKALFCADPNPPSSIKDTAEQLNAVTTFIKDIADWSEEKGLKAIKLNQHRFDLTSCHLSGYSIAAALFALDQLAVLKQLPVAKIEHVINHVTLPGRRQTLAIGGGVVILDVAHNPAALAHLLEQLNREFRGDGTFKCSVVIAMMKDKNLFGNLQTLSAVAQRWFFCDLQGNPRAASAVQLSEQVSSNSTCETLLCKSVAEGVEKAVNLVSSNGVILVVGSFFTVSEASAYLRREYGVAL